MICVYSILSTGFYTGDAIGSDYRMPYIVSILFISACFFLYYIIAFLPSLFGIFKHIKTLNRENVLAAVELLVIISLVLKLIGFVFFGYGVAESRSNFSLGFIFRLVPSYVVFMCLIILPHKIKGRYVFYISLHVITMILMGWTGGLFDIFWLLLFRFMIKNNDYKYVLLVSMSVLVAFLVAPYIYAIKFYIRWGDGFEFEYFSILSHLLSRLSFSPMAIYLLEYSKEFVGAVNVLPGFSFFDSVTAVLPRSLLGISIDNLETLLVAHFTGVINHGVVYYLTLPGKIISSFHISTFDFFVSILVLIFILGLLIFLLSSIFGELMILPWSLIIFKFFLSGNFEEPSYIIYGLIVVFIISHIKLRFG